MHAAFLLFAAVLSIVNGKEKSDTTGFKTCKELNFDPWLYWNHKTKVGERVYFAEIEAKKEGEEKEGLTFRSTCLAKGDGATDEIMDPTVKTQFSQSGGSIAQISTMPCDMLTRFGVQPTGGRRLNSPYSSRRVLDTCNVKLAPSKECKYPKEGQWGWGGVSFGISRCNTKTTSTEDGGVLQDKVTQQKIFGSTIPEEPCVHGDHGEIFFPSGILQIGEPNSEFKVYSYRFANDAEREAALLDERNVGLKYAKEMKGENGCDTEVVYAINALERKAGDCQENWNKTAPPGSCTGGGAFFEMGTTFDALGEGEIFEAVK
jgi:hypothetical protein